MAQRILWAVFLAAAFALFALTAALILFVAWVFVGELLSGAPQPWGAVRALVLVYYAPAWITAIFAFWHLRRFRRTGQRSAMVEIGVSFISALSVIFTALLLFGPL